MVDDVGGGIERCGRFVSVPCSADEMSLLSDVAAAAQRFTGPPVAQPVNPLLMSTVGRAYRGRHRAAPPRPLGDRHRWLRLGVAAGLTALLVPIAGLVIPMISSDPAVMAHASATPKPGSPGGNHSKPGDNKKKKKSDNKKSNNNRQSNGAGSRGSSEGDRESQRSGSSFSQQTNANNRWSADGPNRSVNKRVYSQAQPSQPPQTQTQVIQAAPTQGRQNSTAPISPPQTTQTPPASQTPPVQQQVPPTTPPAQQATQTAQQQPAVAATAPAAPSNPTNPATGLVIGLGAAAGAGLASRRTSASSSASGTGVRVTPQRLAVALTSSQTPLPQSPQPAAAPAFAPSQQDVGVLRQVMANDGVPASQMDQQVNQVVAGANQLNTQIANGTVPQVPPAPTTPVPEQGIGEQLGSAFNTFTNDVQEGFYTRADQTVQSVQNLAQTAENLTGLGGPGHPGVAESWSQLSQSQADQLLNDPLSALSGPTPLGGVITSARELPEAINDPGHYLGGKFFDGTLMAATMPFGGEGALGRTLLPEVRAAEQESLASSMPTMDIYAHNSWTPFQQAQMDMKIDAFNDAVGENGFQQTVPLPRDSGVRQLFLNDLGLDKVPSGMHVDHIVDLQAGGLDAVKNMMLLDGKVNMSFGAQMNARFKDFPPGTIFGKVQIAPPRP